MKYIKQFLIILLMAVLGGVLNWLIPLPIPATVWGMVLMFLALMTGLVKLDQVEDTADFFMGIMPMLFVPLAVGLMDTWHILADYLLPIVIIAYRYGMLWGVGSAFIFSVLQMLFGFSTVSAFFMPGDNQQVWWKAIIICLMDYIIAYTAMCLGGLFRKKANASTALCLGSIVALSARYLTHILSGAIFFGSWAEWWFTDVMGGDFGASVLAEYSGFGLALFYSVIYNGLYMIPEIILTAVGAYIVGKIPAVVGKSQNTL